MFQTFTGSSRRPRQVNLSGRNHNPFAASSGAVHPTVPKNGQNAILHAQQERVARQQERDRLQAAKTFQRIWRGNVSRGKLKDQYRKEWDQRESRLQPETEESSSTRDTKDTVASQEEMLAQLRLLGRFASPSHEKDVKRVQRFASRFYSWLSSCSSLIDADERWIYPLLHIANTSAGMLQRGVTISPLPGDVMNDLLKFLSVLATLVPEQLMRHSHIYYHTLAEIISSSPSYMTSSGLDHGLIEAAILSLLKSSPLDSVVTYEAFASELLTIPDLQQFLGSLDGIAGVLNQTSLAITLNQMLSAESVNAFMKRKSHEEMLWLLSYFIHFSRFNRMNNTPLESPDFNYIKVVSGLLSYLTDDISSRIEASENSLVTPLPDFVHHEILTLVDQYNITGLLTHTDFINEVEAWDRKASDKMGAFANFALTLLRVFPRKGEDILLWLYLGSASSRLYSNTQGGTTIPAIKLFWKIITRTRVYSLVCQEPNYAVDLLRHDRYAEKVERKLSNKACEQEWKIILLFLELYTFVLKVTDDEEFISGSAIMNTSERQSWTSQSALELKQVQNLTIFLKNLAFAMYWNGPQILGSGESLNPTSLADYFGVPNATSSVNQKNENASKADDMMIEGLSGTTLTYMKGIVTGLLRMIYERDSRRSLFPKGHWLMTKYFEMDKFIPAVVTEEDYRRQVQEKDDADDDLTLADTDYDHRDEDALVGTHRTQQVRRVERLKRQQRKTARVKHLERVTPRLEILQNMPFFIPFTTRLEIFREFVTVDQLRRRNGVTDADQWRLSVLQSSGIGPDGRRIRRDDLSKHHAKVRREHVFDDAFDQFYTLGDGLKEPIQITFVDQFDTIEAGIDGGGVTKEFLTSVTNEAFNPTIGHNLFVENDQHLLYPNPSAVDEQRDLLRQLGFKEGSPDWNEPIRDLLRRYEFLGRVIGKCLYEGILVDIHFAPFFLIKWALTGGTGSATNESSYRANINDLRDLDEGLYQGLLQLKNYPGNVEDFSLDFTVTDTISTPIYQSGARGQSTQRTITRDLRPKGSEITVTNENRLVYISFMARHRLQIQPHQQTSAFLRGLSSMIQPSWLSMFNQLELQTLLGGDSSEIDVPDLRRNTLYGGVYVIGDDGQEHPSIRMFWEVMQAFSDADRRKVLKYVTSTPRSPLLGFSQLNPRFSIRDSGSDQTRLPSTSTCVNLLKLPIYSKIVTLREKLLYAINAGAGFNLS